MTAPVLRLECGIQTPLDPATSFMLDSTDWGVLDTDTLGGTVNSVFDAPIQSVSVNRGRSRQLDRFTSGSMVIQFYNADRKLDPLNRDSEYYGQIGPRLFFQLFADDISIFAGFATDWDLEYDITGKDTALLTCSDVFGVLGNIAFSETTPPALAPGPMLSWALSNFGFDGATDFDNGNANLGAYLIDDGTQLLDFMFQVQRSDAGKLFVDAEGTLQYYDRFGRGNTADVDFADDGSGIPYMSLLNEYGDELLYNDVIVSSPAGSAEEFRQDSIDQYGLSVLSYTDLLTSNLVDLQDLAERFLELFQFPRVRFTGLSVELAGLSTAQKDDVLGLDLGSLVTVKRSFSTGSPASVTQELMVTAVRHRIVPGSHQVEFSFEPSPFVLYLRLDDATMGKIDDVNVLG